MVPFVGFSCITASTTKGNLLMLINQKTEFMYQKNFQSVFLRLAVLMLLIAPITSNSLNAQVKPPQIPTFSGGDGSKENPFIIANEADLVALSNYAAKFMPPASLDKYVYILEGKYFRQTADITLTKAFRPIAGADNVEYGNQNHKLFCGNYDGGKHRIYNLNINPITEWDNESDLIEGGYDIVGLFAAVGKNAVLENIYIASGYVRGDRSVAAIAGSLNGEAQIKHCKVGYRVKVVGKMNTAGIVGAIANGTKVSCNANYGNISITASPMPWNLGGIVGTASDATIEGCANFGDLYSQGQIAGGILGSFPPSIPNKSKYNYPTIRSCMNGGDVAVNESIAGGLIGQWPYGYDLGNEQTVPDKVAFANCYNYGQARTSDNKLTFGPIAAYVFKHPVSGLKHAKTEHTYYDADRFVMKEDKTNGDSEIAFALGTPKSHAEIISPEFLNELNEGATILFEADKHKINGGMPILKWINDTYDPEVDKAFQYITDVKPAVWHYSTEQKYLFPQVAKKHFTVVNLDMQQPNIQLKGLGYSVDRAWSQRYYSVWVTKSEEVQLTPFFTSTSRFRKPLLPDASYDQKGAKVANHWLITPPIKVTDNHYMLSWVAGNEVEDNRYRGGYKVYIAEKDTENPDEFSKTPVMVVEMEDAIQPKTITDPETGKETVVRLFKERELNLSAYKGKVVRVAIVDDNFNKWNLFVGRFRLGPSDSMGSELASSNTNLFTARVEKGGVISVVATNANTQISLYAVQGNCLAQAENSLQFVASNGIYIVKATTSSGDIQTQKVIVAHE